MDDFGACQQRQYLCIEYEHININIQYVDQWAVTVKVFFISSG